MAEGTKIKPPNGWHYINGRGTDMTKQATKKKAPPKPKTVTFAGKKMIRVDPQKIENTGNLGWTIVVADRGFVWIGDTLRLGDSVYMANAQNIRQWGTTKGLGELAMEGPKAETELDPVPAVIVPMRAVIAFIPADRAKWPNH